MRPAATLLVATLWTLAGCGSEHRDADPECEPACEGRQCGDDGCGGTCGTCPDSEVCSAEFLCEPAGCSPTCQGRECGDDGCGGTCGACAEGQACSAAGRCEAACTPSCEGRCCGDDGCGGTCPDVCGPEQECVPDSCTCAPVAACGGEIELPTCGETSPPPEGREAIETFVEETALPLKCVSAEGESWDWRAFEQGFEGKALFMFGEVHYSSELGPASAALFEDLVRRGQVDALALEFGLDATEAMNEYIETGRGPLATEYMVPYYPAAMFIRALMEKARELHLEGYEITAFGVDNPSRFDWINGELEAMGSTLDDEARGLLLDTMPVGPRGAMPEVRVSFVDQTAAYYDHIKANLDTICAAIDEASCERIEILARSLWLAAFIAAGLVESGDPEQVMEFFETRETVIIYAYRMSMTTGEERVYAHMGAAHTAKASPVWQYMSVGTALHLEIPQTAGRVYSTAPAYGEGSVIGYEGYYEEPLAAEPALVARALQDEDVDTWFVSTGMPSAECVENPLLRMRDEYYGVALGQGYDALVFVRMLTPEVMEGYMSAMPEPARRILDRLLQVHEAEARLLGGRDLR
jgi:hypothetical protein